MNTLIKKLFIPLIGLSAVVVLLATIIVPLPRTEASAIAQGYITEDMELTEGMAVSLVAGSSKDKLMVERASPSNQSKFVGIVTTLEANLLTLTSKEATVYVTTAGEVQAFATNLNGPIKKGDFLVISPLRGVLMKANPQDTMVIGVAQSDFVTDDTQTRSVVNNDGSRRDAAINTVVIDLSPRTIRSDQSFLVAFGKALTGKTVTPLQVLVAVTIFILLIIIEGAIIYGAVHSTLTSIGRNPLAKSALYKQLAQVILIACVILAFGIGSIYIVLWA